jgi:hypothetical protein
MVAGVMVVVAVPVVALLLLGVGHVEHATGLVAEVGRWR